MNRFYARPVSNGSFHFGQSTASKKLLFSFSISLRLKRILFVIVYFSALFIYMNTTFFMFTTKFATYLRQNIRARAFILELIIIVLTWLAREENI